MAALKWQLETLLHLNKGFDDTRFEKLKDRLRAACLNDLPTLESLDGIRILELASSHSESRIRAVALELLGSLPPSSSRFALLESALSDSEACRAAVAALLSLVNLGAAEDRVLQCQHLWLPLILNPDVSDTAISLLVSLLRQSPQPTLESALFDYSLRRPLPLLPLLQCLTSFAEALGTAQDACPEARPCLTRLTLLLLDQLALCRDGLAKTHFADLLFMISSHRLWWLLGVSTEAEAFALLRQRISDLLLSHNKLLVSAALTLATVLVASPQALGPLAYDLIDASSAKRTAPALEPLASVIATFRRSWLASLFVLLSKPAYVELVPSRTADVRALVEEALSGPPSLPFGDLAQTEERLLLASWALLPLTHTPTERGQFAIFILNRPTHTLLLRAAPSLVLNPAALDLFRALLLSPSVDVSLSALNALARSPVLQLSLADSLKVCLESSSTEVRSRFFFFLSLSLIASQVATAAVECLQSCLPNLQGQLLAATVRVLPVAPGPVLRLFLHCLNTDALTSLASAVYEPLLPQLGPLFEHEDFEVKRLAVLAVCSAPGPLLAVERYWAQLLASLADPDRLVGVAVREGLASCQLTEQQTAELAARPEEEPVRFTENEEEDFYLQQIPQMLDCLD